MTTKQSDFSKLRIGFSEMIAKGELGGPDGFRAQTANGTAYWKGTGWNDPDGYGAGWPAGRSTSFSTPELMPDATRRAGRSNRTGE
jgi:hypothetical protein